MAEYEKKVREVLKRHGFVFHRHGSGPRRQEVVSPAWETDAAHIAMTSVSGLDFIVSLNFTHIARPWTVERVRRVNAREGYKGLGIYKPAEVLESEDDTRIHERSPDVE